MTNKLLGKMIGKVRHMEGLSHGEKVNNSLHKKFYKNPSTQTDFFYDLRIFEDKVVRKICGAKKQEATRAWKDLNKMFH